jgi:hypothetical protein
MASFSDDDDSEDENFDFSSSDDGEDSLHYTVDAISQRGYDINKLQREAQAATTIQRTFRGYHGRKEYVQLLWDKMEKDEAERRERMMSQVEEGLDLMRIHDEQVKKEEEQILSRSRSLWNKAASVIQKNVRDHLNAKHWREEQMRKKATLWTSLYHSSGLTELFQLKKMLRRDIEEAEGRLHVKLKRKPLAADKRKVPQLVTLYKQYRLVSQKLEEGVHPPMHENVSPLEQSIKSMTPNKLVDYVLDLIQNCDTTTVEACCEALLICEKQWRAILRRWEAEFSLQHGGKKPIHADKISVREWYVSRKRCHVFLVSAGMEKDA